MRGGDEWVRDHARIVNRYLNGNFTFDVFTSFPYDMIADYTRDNVNGAWVRSIKLLRLMKLLRLLKVHSTHCRVGWQWMHCQCHGLGLHRDCFCRHGSGNGGSRASSEWHAKALSTESHRRQSERVIAEGSRSVSGLSVLTRHTRAQHARSCG